MPTIVAIRGLLFMAFWLVLMPSSQCADLSVGLLATLAATWASLYLLPAGNHVRLAALLSFAPHFLAQSLVAGLDVARRVLQPNMPLQVGLVVCPVDFPAGLSRNAFALITSLLPGSVPVQETDTAIIYHSLDTTQPVAQQMAAEEKLLANALVQARV